MKIRLISRIIGGALTVRRMFVVSRPLCLSGLTGNLRQRLRQGSANSASKAANKTLDGCRIDSTEERE
jgi:hypothetical protein